MTLIIYSIKNLSKQCFFFEDCSKQPKTVPEYRLIEMARNLLLSVSHPIKNK